MARPPLNLIFLAALVLLSASSSARQQQQESSTVFADVIDVRVVNIEVVVTDRSGNRVPGLKASAFELRVDGETVPVDYFTEIEEGRALVAGEGGTVAAVPSLEAGAPVGTSVLLFVDDFFSLKRDRDRVLDRLEEDFADLGHGDQVAAVAFDGRTVAC